MVCVKYMRSECFLPRHATQSMHVVRPSVRL